MAGTGRDWKGIFFAFTVAIGFIFIGWYHLEDRVIAPHLLGGAGVESFEAKLLRVVDAPDTKEPAGGGRGSGWQIFPGKHVLYFEGHGPIEFPRSMAEQMHALSIGESYRVEGEIWGRPFWRRVRDSLPKIISNILNIERRGIVGHRMLLSLEKDGEVILGREALITEARKGVFFGLFLTLFFGGFGLLFLLGGIEVLFEDLDP